VIVYPPCSRRNGIAAVVIALSFLLAGCHGGPTETVKASNPPAQPGPGEISISNALLGQIKVGEPSVQAVGKTLQVSARVEADETRVARVGAPVSGRVTALMAVEGQNVGLGERIAALHSTELSNIELTFLEALSQQQLADKAVKRAQQLLQADVIGSAELDRREAELQQKTEEADAAHAQLTILGLSEEAIKRLQNTREIDSVTYMTSGVAGTVLERKITIGQVLQPAETAFLVADLSRVWLTADVPEDRAGDLEIGKRVEAETAAYPGDPVRGTLSFVSSTVDPQTRTVRIRMNLANPRHKYKPQMLASMTIRDDSAKERIIPVTALVREDNKDFVFVQKAPTTFVLRSVTLGLDTEKQRVLEGGLEPGEKIVLDGAFHLNNERKRLALSGGK
jgi:membrane fusion protein, heavy metal efflux system